MYTMGIQKGSKLNKLLKVWPPGTVAVSEWLAEQGVDRQLVQRYKRTDWVKSIGSGAFVRSGDSVGWPGGVYALQTQLKMPVHPAGKTALQLLGFAHNLPLGGISKIILFGRPKARLPRWFLAHNWGVRVNHRGVSLFNAPWDLGTTFFPVGLFRLRVSSAERAMFEVLDLVPTTETFNEAQKLMDGLVALRPALVQSLLEKCTSIKVKRLFMFMAEASGHLWVNKLNLAKVEFGKGGRVVFLGGRFDAKYKITVPQTNE